VSEENVNKNTGERGALNQMPSQENAMIKENK